MVWPLLLCAALGSKALHGKLREAAVVEAPATKARTRRGWCVDELRGTFADMHDGDQKHIVLENGEITITPGSDAETWVIKGAFDADSCSAMLDFNVSGKEEHPPVPLLATLWYAVSESDKKSEFEFTDPSGTIAARTDPLNRWVELKSPQKSITYPCPTQLKAVFADLHDGDRKEVSISGTTVTIKPAGGGQDWEVTSSLEPGPCSAMVNFNVSGKPSPPPVPLRLTFFYTYSAEAKKAQFEFTDPSGTLAAPDAPLNQWIEVGTSLGA